MHGNVAAIATEPAKHTSCFLLTINKTTWRLTHYFGASTVVCQLQRSKEGGRRPGDMSAIGCAVVLVGLEKTLRFKFKIADTATLPSTSYQLPPQFAHQSFLGAAPQYA
jgi:hypothetical protein